MKSLLLQVMDSTPRKEKKGEERKSYFSMGIGIGSDL
jgi:hypothetical protein